MHILAVTNIYPAAHAPASGTFVKMQIEGLQRIGLNVDVMYVDRVRKGMAVYVGLGRQARRKVAELSPDLVHVMYGGVMADQVTRAVFDRPTVVTFQGSDLLGEHSSGFLRKLVSAYGVRASWNAARRAHGIVTVSKALRDSLPKYVDRSKVRIIPCGIDLDLFRPLDRNACRRQLDWGNDRFHVLFPANTGNPVKQPSLARAAVKAVQRLGVPAQMHQLQGVTHSQVPVWLNAADVLLLTSLQEGSPTIIKEALACNLPVVSVDVGDVLERIDGIQGCYVASPEPSDLSAKLQMVHTCKHRVEGRVQMQELSLERIALRLKSFYDAVLLSGKREHRLVPRTSREQLLVK